MSVDPELNERELEQEHLEAGDIPPVGTPEKWDYETDIIVVGGGGSGLCATAAALKNNAKVIVVEKQEKTGGHSQYGGIAAAFNTKAAKRKGLTTSREKAFKTGVLTSNATVDPRILAALIDRSHEVFDWSETQSWGRRWDALVLGHIPAQGICRHHVKGTFVNAPFMDGKQLLGCMYPWLDWLQADAREKGAEILLNTEVTALVKEGDRILGIEARSKDGSTIFVKGNKAVILAGSNFTNNRAMIRKYCPDAYKKAMGTFLPPSDTGEVIRMAFGAGADVAGRNSWCAFSGGIPFYDTKYTAKSEPGPWFQFLRQGWLQLARCAGWLEINKACEEFVPEAARADFEMHPRLMASQPGSAAYVIFDADYEINIWKTVPPPVLDDRPITPEDNKLDWYDQLSHMVDGDWRDSVKKAKAWGGIKTSDTISGLAKELALDPVKLENAVKKWNEKAARNKPDEFGRLPVNMMPIMKPPYFGIKTGAIIAGMFCGPRVNFNWQVLDKNLNPIPGLYAAGLTAGGTNGEGIFAATILSTLGLAYITGWIAGDHASSEKSSYSPAGMEFKSDIPAQRMMNTLTKYSSWLGDMVMKTGFSVKRLLEKKAR